MTRLDRTATIAGAVTFSGRFRGDSDTRATASVGGDAGKGGNANAQRGKGLAFDDARSGRTTAAPSAETSSGDFGAAAAIAFDSEGGAVDTLVGAGGSLTATGAVTLEALHDVDVTTVGDGSVVKGGAAAGVGAAVAVNALSLKTTASVLGTVAASNGITVRASGLSTDASSANKDVISATAIAGAGATTFGLAGALALNVIDLDSTARAAAASSLSGGAKPIVLNAVATDDVTTIATSNAAAGSGGSGVGIGVGVALAILDSDAVAEIDGLASVAGNGGLQLLAQGTHAAHGKAEAGAVSGSVSVAPSTYIVVSKNDTAANLPDGTDLVLKGAVVLEAKHAIAIDGTSAASGAGASAGLGLSLTLGLVADTAQAVVGRSLATDGAVTVRAVNAVDVTLATTASSAGGKAEGAQTKSDDQVKKELDFANLKKGGTAATAPKAETSSGGFGLAAALSLSIVNGQALAQVAAGKSVTSGDAVLIEALADVDSSVKADGSVVKGGAAAGVGAAVAVNALSLKTTAAVLGTVAATNGITVRASGLSTDASSANKDVISATAIAGAGATTFGLAGALALNVIDLDSTARAAAASSLSGGAKPIVLNAVATDDVTTIATSNAAAGSGGSGVGIGVGVALAILDSDAVAEIDGLASVAGNGGLQLLAQGTHAAHGKAEAGAVSGSVSVAPSTYIVVSKNDTAANLPDGTDLVLKGAVVLEAKHAIAIDGTSAASGAGASAGLGLSLTLGLVADTAQAVVGRSLATDGAVTVRAVNAVDVTLATTASSAGGKAEGAQTKSDDQVKKELDFANLKKGGTAATAPKAETSSGGFGLAAALSLSIVNGQALAQVAAGKSVTSGDAVLIEALADVDSSVKADGSVVKGGAAAGVGAAVAVNALSLKTTAAVLGTVAATNGITVRASGLSTDASSANKDVISATAIAGAGATTFGLAGALALNVIDLDSTARAAAASSLSGGAKPIVLNAVATDDVTTIATSNAAAGSGGSGVGIGVGVALAILDSDAVAEIDGLASVAGNGGLQLLAQGTHAAHGKAEAGAVSGSVSVAPSTYIVVSKNDTAANLPDGTDLVLKGAVVLEAKHAIAIDGTSAASGAGASAGLGLSLTLGLVADTAQAVVGRSLATDGAVTVRAVNAVDVTLATTASSAGGKAEGAQTKSDDQVKKELDFANLKKGGTAATAPKAETSSGGFGLAAALSLSIVNGQALAQVAAGKSVTSGDAVLIEALADVDSSVKADGSVVKGGAAAGVGAAVAVNALSLKTTAAVLGTVAATNGITVRASGLSTDASSANKDVISATAIAGAGATTFGLAGALALNVIDLDSTARAAAASSLSGGAKPIVLNAVATDDVTTIATSNAAAGSGGSGVGIGVGVALAILDSDAVAEIDGLASVAGNGGLQLLAQGTHAAHGKAEAGAVSGSVSVAPSTYIVVSKNDTAANLPDGTDLVLKGAVVLEAKHAIAIDGTSAASGAGASAGLGLSLTLGLVADTAQAVVGRSLATDGAVTVRAVNAVDVTLATTASSAGGKAEGAQTKSDDQVKKELDFANLKKGGTAATAPKAETSSGGFGLAAALSLSIVNGQALAQVAAGKSVTSGDAVLIEALADVDSSVKADGSVVKGGAAAGVGAAVAVNALSLKTTAAVLGTVAATNGITVRASGLSTDASSANKDVISATAIAGAGATTFGLAGALALNVIDLDSTARAAAASSLSGGAKPIVLNAVATDDVTTIATSNAAAGSGGSGVGIGVGVALAILDSDAVAEIDGLASVAGNGGLQLLAQGTHAAHGKAEAGAVSGSVSVAPSTYIVVSKNDTAANLPDGTDLVLKGAVVLEAKHAIAIDGTSAASGAGASAGLGLSLTLGLVADTAQAVVGRSLATDGAVTVRAVNAVDVTLATTASSAGGKAEGAQTKSDDQVKKELDFANLKKGGTAATAPKAETSSGGFGLAAALSLSIVNGQALAQVAAGKSVTSGDAVLIEALADVDSSVKADGSVVKGGAAAGVGAAVAVNALSLKTTAAVLGTVAATNGITVRASGLSTDASSANKDVISATAIAGAGATTFGLAGALALNVIDLDSTARAAAASSLSGGAKPIVLNAVATDDVTTIATSNAAAGSGGSGVGIGVGVALAILDSDAVAEIDGLASVAGNGGLQLLAQGTHAAHGKAEAGAVSGSVSVAPSTYIVVSKNDTAANLPDGTDLVLKGAVVLEAKHAIAIDGTSAASGAGASAGLGLSLTLGLVADTAQAVVGRSLATDGAVTVRAVNAVDVTLATTASSAGGKAEGAQTKSDDQVKKELDFANLKKGGTAATAPKAETSSGGFGLAAALSLSIVNGQALAQVAAGKSVTSGDAVLIEALADVDSSVKADGSVVKGGAAAGVGAAVAVNALSLKTTAAVLGTVAATNGITVRASGLSTDASSANKDVISATAIAGAGATTFGLAGALALNVIDLDSTARAAAASSLSGGAKPIVLNAVATDDVTTIATSNAAAGSGGSGVGIGVGVALAILDSDAVAEIDGLASVAGNGGLQLLAQGTHAAHGKAEAGAVSGSVSVAPSTYIVVSKNDTAANLPDGTDLVLKGAVVLEAKHAIAIDGTSAASGAGASAGLGLSLTLGLVADTAQAVVGRSLATDGAVTVRAVNAVDVTLATTASSAGGKAEGAQTKSDDQVKKELDFANLKKGGTAATANSAQAPDANGSGKGVGIAAAISLSIVNASAIATLPAGKFIKTAGAVTVETVGDVDSRVRADGQTVDGSNPSVGVGVAVAMNVINFANSATVQGDVTSGGLAIRAVNPADQAEIVSVISATAISGAGAQNVGVAGAFAANFLDMNSDAILTGKAIETATGDVELRAEMRTRPEVAATSNAAAIGENGGSSGVGVGLSVALNIVDNDATAEIKDGIVLTGGRDLTIVALGANITKTVAVAGSSGGSVGISPSLALLVAEDQATARLGTGAATNLSGAVTISATNKLTAETRSDASVKGASTAGVGAAVAINLAYDAADAGAYRNIVAGKAISVSADQAIGVSAISLASSKGASPKGSGEPTTADGQVAGMTSFANTQSGAGATAPQVAKSNGGRGSEQSVGVGAALSLNVVPGHARAILPATITVKSTGGGVAVTSGLDVDARAEADGSTVAKGSVGIGVGVALNVINVDNTALLAAPTTAKGDVTVSATMSAQGDGTDTFIARANAGAGAKSVGVAGAVAIDLITVATNASIIAATSAGGGSVAVVAGVKSDTTTTATSAATGNGGNDQSGVGVGAAFALSVLDLDSTALIPDTIPVTGAANFTVKASGVHAARTAATAGSAGNVSVSPAVALTVATSNTRATLGKGAGVVASGNVLIEAVHGGDYDTKADAQAGGADVSVGAAIAIGIVMERGSASLQRDVTAGGDVRIRARNPMSSSVSAIGGAGGNSDSGTETADSESNAAVNNNSNIKNNADVQAMPGGKVDVPKAGQATDNASTTAQSESGGKGSGGVGVAAAIGVNVVTTGATAEIAANRVVKSGGAMEISSALQVDGSAKAFGTAIRDLQKDTAIGAGVALNVVSASNLATVGDTTALRAATGLTISATMAQRGVNDVTNEFVVQAGAASGAKKNGIAGSVAIDIVTYDTKASLGSKNDVIVSAGAASLAATAQFTVQNLAGSAAFGSDIGIGAAVVVQSSVITTNATIGDNTKLDATGGLGVAAATSYVPRAENFKGLLTVSLSSGAFGGGASDESTAIGGSVAVNVINIETQALVGDFVTINQRFASTGPVKIEASSLVRLFSGAGGVGASLGDTGIGIGIDITIVNQKTLAQIGDSVALQAGGDVSVTATSRNQQTAIAGSFGGSKQNAGAGSIIVNLFNMGADPLKGTRARTGSDTVIVSGGKVSVIAANPSAAETDTLKLIAGSAGLSGQTAVGIASVTAIREDLFEARIGNRNTITVAKGLDVIARSARSIDMIAAAGAGGVKTGGAGSLTVLTLTETATATIGLDAKVTGSGVSDVRVLAEDRTTMTRVAGAIGFGGNNGIGAGLDVGVVNKTTTASIAARSVVTTGGSVEVRAFSKEDLTALAVSGGAGGELAIAGSVDVVVHTIKTRAFIEGTASGAKTTVKAAGNVIVEASAENEFDIFAGGLAAAGSNAIGASAPIPVLNKTTEAFIGTNAIVEGKGLLGTSDVRSGGFAVTYVDAPKTGTPEVTTTLTKGDGFTLTAKGNNDPNKGLPGGTSGVGDATGEKVRKVVAGSLKMKGVAVSATAYDDIGLVGISGGAAGSVAVNVTGVVNVSNIKTSARIDNGATINVANVGSTSQSVLVVGSSDYSKLTVSIGLAVSGSVAVAPSVAVDAISLTSEALVGGGAQVFARDTVAVKARSAQDVKSVVASLAASGTASIAGSPAILVLTSTTTARIGTIAASDTPATVKAGGSIVVQAIDDTKALAIAGSGGFAGTAGIGAGVGIMVITKDTTARIAGGSVIDAGAATGVAGVDAIGGINSRFGPTIAGLIVQAGSSEDLQSYAIAGGVGGYAGVAGGVGVTIVDSDTAATIGNSVKVNQAIPAATGQDVRVAARNEVSVISVAGGLGGGLAGVAGAIGVGIIRNGTEASIGLAALVKSGGTVTVDAVSKQDIVAVSASAALGGFAGAISFGTWIIGGDYNSGGGAASESAWAGTYQDTLTGAAFGGYQGVLGGYKPISIVAANVGAASDTIDLKTDTLRTGDAIVYNPAAGSSITGLVAGETYYVIKTGTLNRYKLALTAKAAEAGTAINLGSAVGSATFALGANARAEAGLSQARSGLSGGAPSASLSASLASVASSGVATEGTVALVKAGAGIVANNGMRVSAKDDLKFTQVAGVVAAGGTGIGGAFATLVHKNTVLADVGDNADVAVGGSGLAVSALSSETVSQVAAGAAGAGSAAILGSVTVSILNETTKATLGAGVDVTASASVAGVNPDVLLTANDNTTLTDVAGALGFGGAAAIGVGVDVVTLTKVTITSVGAGTKVTTAGSFEGRSSTNEDIVSVAIAGGLAGSVAVNASASIVVASIDTEALLVASPSTVILAGGNVVVEAAARSEFDLWGGSFSAAGAAAVGGAAAVPVITKKVKAEVGDGVSITGRGLRNDTSVRNGGFTEAVSGKSTDVKTDQAGDKNLNLGGPSYSDNASGDDAAVRDGYDANQTGSGDSAAGTRKAQAAVTKGFRGVAVSASNSDDVSSFGMAAGAAGAASVQLAGAIQVINVETLARVGLAAKINTASGSGTSQDVLIASGNDFRSLNVGASAAVAGAVSVAPSASVQVVNVSSEAIVEKNAVINATRSVVVSATGSEKITAVSAALAVAGYAGVALAPNVLVLDSKTHAYLGNTGPANVTAGGSVAVLASDRTRLIGVVGALGGGVAGIGAGVNIALVTKDTVASIGNSSVIVATATAGQGDVAGVLLGLGDAGLDYDVQVRAPLVRGVVVQAVSSEDVTTFAGAGGVGLVGIAGAVNVLVVNSDTIARIGDAATVTSGQSVVVAAANTVDSFAFTGSLAVGFVGIGGAVNVGTIRNASNASIGAAANVTSGAATEVIALSRKKIDALSIGAAAGVVSATGSIGLITIGGDVDSNYNYGEKNSDGTAGGTKGDNALGDGATGWNNKYDGYANGSSNPGGSNGSIMDNHAGSGGSNSRVASAAAAAKPLVSAAKPKTSISAQLAAGADLQGTIAHIDGGAVIKATGDVVVRAQDATTVTSTVGSFSGGVVSLGAPVTIVNLSMPVRAIISSNVKVTADGSVKVDAVEVSSVKGFAFAGQGGLGAFGAQVVYVRDSGEQTAEVRGGTIVTSKANVQIVAAAQQTVKVRAFGATFSAVGAGASVAIADISGATRAFSDGKIDATGSTTINASVVTVADSKSFGVGVAVAANLNGAVSIATVSKPVEARTGASSTTISGGAITIAATANMDATAESYAISVAIGAGLGISVAVASVTPSVLASAGGLTTTQTRLSVIASFNTDSVTGNKIGGLGASANAFTVGVGAVAGVAGAVALATTTPTVTARINDNATVTGSPSFIGAPDVVVRTATSLEALAEAKGLAFGLGAGLGASVSSAIVGGTQTARIGANVKIGGVVGASTTRVSSIVVETRSTNVADAQSFGVAGGIFVGSSVNSAYARVNPTLVAEVAAGALIFTSSLAVRAIEDQGLVTSKSKGVTIAGGGAVGFSQATSEMGTITRASIGGGARALVNATNDVTVDATTTNSLAFARADASGGAILGSVQVNRAVAKSTGSTTARIADADILSSNFALVRIKATSLASVDAFSSGKSIGLVAGIGSMDAQAILSHATLAELGAGAKIGASFVGDGTTYYPVGTIEITAVGIGLGKVRAEGAAAGLVGDPTVNATLDVKSSARAIVGASTGVFAKNSITISSNDRAEGDASLSGASVGFAALGTTSITHNVLQTAETLIGGGADLHVTRDSGPITITAKGGMDPAPPRNYTVTADGVVASSEQIVITGHGLKTGDIIQLGTAGSSFGGVATGRILPILRIDDNTIMFGRDVAGANVNANRDTITFDAPHFLQTGDKVKYGPAGGASTSYWVYVLNDTTIRLLDFDPTTGSGKLRLAGKGFTNANIAGAADTITINAHGFNDGDLVTYRAARTQFSFGSGDVDVYINGLKPNGKPNFVADAAVNQIYIPGHTFTTGDLVTYSVTGGSALPNLVNNTVYQVVKVDGNFVQLKPQAGGSVIGINSDLGNLQAVHTLKRVGSGVVAGLVDGAVYRVQKIDANTIKLKTQAGVVVNIAAAGVGTHVLARDGVDLAAVTATQRVTLDLQSGGSTTLLGIGGVALDAIIADTGDGVSRVTADGLVIGAIASGDNRSVANVTSVVRSIVSGGTTAKPTKLVADDVNVTADGRAFGSTTVSGDGGGLFAFPSGMAQTLINGTTEALIGQADVNPGTDSTYVSVQNAININANARYGAQSSAGGTSGGLVSISDTNAKAATTYLTRAGFGQGVEAYSMEDISIAATTSHNEDANMRNTSGGLGAGSRAGRGDSGAFASGANTVLIGAGTQIRAQGTLTLQSRIMDSSLRAKAYSYSGAAFGGSRATGQASASDQAGVVLQSGSLLQAYDGLVIFANVSNYKVTTDAKAELDALGGSTVATSNNNVTVRAFVDAQDGATVETRVRGYSYVGHEALRVEVYAQIARDVYVDADGAVFGPDDEETPGSDQSTREIVWNADVLMLKDDNAYLDLQIDSSGRISESNGITVNGGYSSVGTYVAGSGTISVDNITARESYGRAVFRAYSNYDGIGNLLGNQGTVSGTQGKWTLEKGISVLSIRNYSDAAIKINNIDALGKTISLGSNSPYYRYVSIEAGTSSAFRFDISTIYDVSPLAFSGEPSIQITNYNFSTTANIILAGLIDNPLGRVYISAGNASIYVDNANAVVRGNYVSLSTGYYGGSIGSAGGGGEFKYYYPVRVELVDSDGHQAQGTFSAGGQIVLDITARARTTAGTVPVVNVDFYSRTSTMQVVFNRSLYDWYLSAAAPYGIVAGTTQFNAPAVGSTYANNNYYREYYQPDFTGGVPSPQAHGAFAESFGFTVGASYNVTYVNSSANFSFTAGSGVSVTGPGGVGARVALSSQSLASSPVSTARVAQVAEAPAAVSAFSVTADAAPASDTAVAPAATLDTAPAEETQVSSLTTTIAKSLSADSIVLPASLGAAIQAAEKRISSRHAVKIAAVKEDIASFGKTVSLKVGVPDFANEQEMAPLPLASLSHFDAEPGEDVAQPTETKSVAGVHDGGLADDIWTVAPPAMTSENRAKPVIRWS